MLRAAAPGGFNMDDNITRAAWRPAEWLRAVPVSRAKLTLMIASAEVPSFTVGRSRFISEAPQNFVARMQAPKQPAA